MTAAKKKSDAWKDDAKKHEQRLESLFPSFHRVDPDKFRIDKIDTSDRRDAKGHKLEKDEGVARFQALRQELVDLQYLFYAENKTSLLVVLQAMDAGGKDGTIRHVFGPLNPQGVRVRSFKAPNDRELNHDFLWRVHPHAPPTGHIQVFNRSHYEDVLIARVLDLVPEWRWRKRYDHINHFEETLSDNNTVVVKFMLHISLDEQKERLQKRLDDPTRRWKFSKADLEQRARWPAYMEAFEEALRQTSTPTSPWYVIPANRKWYRNFAITSILVEIMKRLEMKFPQEEEGLDSIVIQ